MIHIQYFGGKQRISRQISEYINSNLAEGQDFIDLFCGSCNIVSKIKPNRRRIANDKHVFLIQMWRALRDGWIPPDELSRENWEYLKENQLENMPLTAFAGFGCSFGGIWFSSYAVGDYGGHSRNYALSAKKKLLDKISHMKDVEFLAQDYKDVYIPPRSFVYCDIPYKDTAGYSVGAFNHDEFYDWVRENREDFTCYISEYKHNIPTDFEIVWELEHACDMRKKTENFMTTEVIVRLNT